MILALLACTEPPRLDRVEQALADELALDAEPSLRLFIALTGFVAETCGVEPVDEEHVFSGDAAAALGITSAADTVVDRWTFEGVGLDGEEGTLVISNADRRAFEVTWTGTTAMTAELDLSQCDLEEGEELALPRVTGTAAHEVDGGQRQLTTFGTLLVWGIGVMPPRAGQVRWTLANQEVTLDDASKITDSWPGVATSPDWERAISVALP